MQKSTKPRLKNKPTPKDHMHMSTKPRLAPLYVQHLPHVKKQAHPCKTYAKRSYAHFHMCPHPKTTSKTLTTKDHMHMSTKPRLASLYVQHLAFPTCEETSPSLQDICQKIICTLPHVKNKPSPKAYAHVYKTQTSLSLRATSSTCEEQAHAQRSYAHFHM